MSLLYIQQYETLNLPIGFTLKLVLNSTWGDPHYVGLNGIEIFDGNGESLLFPKRKEYVIMAEPSSVYYNSPS